MKLVNVLTLIFFLVAVGIIPQSIEVHSSLQSELSYDSCHEHHQAHAGNQHDSKPNKENHNCHDSCHMACCHITLSFERPSALLTQAHYKTQSIFFFYNTGPPQNVSIQIFRPPIIG